MASAITSPASSELQLLQSTGRSMGCHVAGSQQYPYPSHVHAASFVSIKLSGKTNYAAWREQMMCLVGGHDMLGFLDGKFRNPKENGDGDSGKKADETAMEAKYWEWKRSDTLVKGWIFGSLNGTVMRTVVGLQTAEDVWKKLHTAYSTPPKAPRAARTTTTTTSYKDPAEYIQLSRAIHDGDWEKAQELLEKDKSALTAKLSYNGDRALHYAVSKVDNIQFVKNLLSEINPESLPALVNRRGIHPLYIAALADNHAAAKELVKKNPLLLFIADDDGYLPIHGAIFVPHEKTFRYLLDVSEEYIELSQQKGYHSPFEGIKGAVLLTNVINAGLFDVAYQLIKKYPDMARTKDGNVHVPLSCIARKVDAYYSGTRYNFHERFVYSLLPIDGYNGLGDTEKVQDIENQETYKAVTKCWRICFHQVIQRVYVKVRKSTLLQVPYIKRLQDDREKHNKAAKLLKCICDEVGKIAKQNDLRNHYTNATALAAKNDTPEAVELLIKSFPQAISSKLNGHYLSQLSVINRCEKVYSLLVHKTSENKYLYQFTLDKDNNNLLHLAGQLAPAHKLNEVSGAALQMQRELQWFKEVEKFVQPKHKEAKNKAQETPIMVFRREHEALRKEGEEWMKKTADSCTITAALIVTIVFAAAITVPGGNDGDSGKPIFTTKPSFIIFAVSDAISLFTSTTSLLLFLSILTARYAEEDFLYTLPRRLIYGLVLLFLSITTMMVAFSATLYLMFGQAKAWILIPIAVLTCLPIASFVKLQFPLLVALTSSTYQGVFGKNKRL